MDPVEFIEKVLGVQLLEYQKQLVKKLASIPKDERRFIYGRRGFIYVIPKTENKPVTYQRGLRAKVHIIDDCCDKDLSN